MVRSFIHEKYASIPTPASHRTLNKLKIVSILADRKFRIRGENNLQGHHSNNSWHAIVGKFKFPH